MGLLGFLLDLLGPDDSDKQIHDFKKNDSWFEHEGEEHDTEDGYCCECDDDEDNLI